MERQISEPQARDVNLDPGLSLRMRSALDALASNTSCATPLDALHASSTIDLSNAQNEVLRPELLEFFKTTVEDKIAENAFELPPGNGGDTATREALASFFNSHFKPIHDIKTEHIAITAGATDALESIIHAICDDGDSIIIPGPFWYGLERITKARANVNIVVAKPPTYQNYDNYLLPSLQAAYDFSADKSRIKAVLICNPHNPLSRCYPKKALVECMEFCQERGLHLISDEIYALSPLNGTPSGSPQFVSALSLTEPLVPEGAVKIDPSRVHIVWAASKLFGSSGFRVGCIISQQNPQLLAGVSLLTAHHTNNIASLYLSSLLTWTQLSTLLALNSERLTASYRLLADTLTQLGVEFITPTDGIFIFAKLAKYAQSAEDEADFYGRLTEHGVRIQPGSIYKGVDKEFGWARVRFSTSLKVMEAALERLATFITMEG